MERYYNIAGLRVKMDTFGTTAKRAEAYRCAPTERVDMTVCSTWEKNKHLHPGISDDVGEHLSTAAHFYRQLLSFDGMMLHSSAVAVDGKAYLFTADSGVGKSTHTGLWLELFGDRAFVLNDDKPAVRLEQGVWYAYGTPWSGKHDISQAEERVPIAGIAVIERAEENSIVPFGGVDAIHAILRQTNRPRDSACRVQLLSLLDRLFDLVPVWKLRCNRDLEAARIAYEAMAGCFGKDEKK